MGHTYTNLMYHIVFSTKERRRSIDGDIVPRLVQFTGGIVRDLQGSLLEMNAVEDHAHLLAILSSTLSIADQVRDIKAGASKWIHRTYSAMQDFAWQEGYGAFSVSKSSAQAVANYIQEQASHHQTMSFEQEFIALLQKHGIEYDPRYVLG
jgi:putative transposase